MHCSVYPTAYTGYDMYVSIWGTLSTTASNGEPTCVRVALSGQPAVFTLPSHPPLTPRFFQTYVPPPEAMSEMKVESGSLAEQASLDPRGWTFTATAVTQGDACDFIDAAETVFPGLGMWDCQYGKTCAAPDVYAGTALYLTHTSISTEAGDADAQAVDASPSPSPAAAQATPASADSAPTPAVSPQADNQPSTSPPQPAPNPVTTPAAASSPIKPPPAPAAPSVPPPAMSAAPPSVSESPENQNPPPQNGNQVSPGQLAASNEESPPADSPSDQSLPGPGPSQIHAVGPESFPLGSGAAVTSVARPANPSGNAGPAGAVVAVSAGASQPPAPLPTLVVGGQTIAPNSASQYAAAGQTLAIGAPILLGSSGAGETIVLQSSNSVEAVVVGASTAAIVAQNPPENQQPAATALSPIVIAGNTIVVDSASHLEISGQTLAAGAPVVVSSPGGAQTVLLQSSGAHEALIIGSSTQAISVIPAASLQALEPTNPPSIVVNGETITANSASHYIVSGQTLQPGSSITLGSGTSITLVALQTSESGTALVVGFSTSEIPSSSVSAGIGGFVAGGFGPPTSSSPANATSPVAFMGDAPQIKGSTSLAWIWSIFGGLTLALHV